MQVNIDAFVIVQRNLEQVSRDFSIAPSTLVGSSPPTYARPPALLHALKVPISTAANVLREGDNFTLEARLTSRQHRCKFCRFFRPETGSILQWLREWWCLLTAINRSVFPPVPEYWLQLRQHFLLEFDHVLDGGAAGRLSERHGPP